MNHIFCIVLALCLSCPLLRAQENPFMQMAGQPYRTYYVALDQLVYQPIDSAEPTEAARIAGQMRETARRTGQQKWALEADFYEHVHTFHHTLWVNRGKPEVEASEGEKLIPDLLVLLKRARKLPEKDLAIRICQHIFSVYFNQVRNYELGFRYGLEMDKLLSGVSAADFPLKPLYYIRLMHQYSRLGEYKESKLYCYKVLEDPLVAYQASHALEQALNELGNIYRTHDNDLAKSDSCYRSILDIRIPDTCDVAVRADYAKEHALWSDLARAQLGVNFYLRGDYDKAIPLLTDAVTKIPAHNPYNYGFTASKALTLVDIYMRKNDLRAAGRYLDSAYVFIQRTPEKWRHTYYPVAAHYYGAVGNTRLAVAYMDSALNSQQRYEDDFNLRKLHRAEQQSQQETLEAAQLRNENYRQTVWLLAGFTAVVFLLSALLFYFYQQKRKAYRALVQRIQQWAQGAAYMPFLLAGPESESELQPTEAEYTLVEEGTPSPVYSPDAEDLLFERMHQLILTEQLFRNSKITQEEIARRMNVNRVYLSLAVNHQTGKNFSTYINEFRIKEAVRIMSENTGKLTLESIAYESGFNDRRTFCAAFKRITGLTPSEFRSSRQKG